MDKSEIKQELNEILADHEGNVGQPLTVESVKNLYEHLISSIKNLASEID